MNTQSNLVAAQNKLVKVFQRKDFVHHNRILSVIRNKKNKSKHLTGIRNMVENFSKMFPFSYKLSQNLMKEYFNLQNRVL